MKAIAVVPGTKTVQLVDRPEPAIVAPDDIKLKVLRVGICGTDREEAAGGRAKAPPVCPRLSPFRCPRSRWPASAHRPTPQ